jgi:hypothetical protein
MNLYKIISEIKAQLAGIKKNKVGHIQSKIIIGMNNSFSRMCWGKLSKAIAKTISFVFSAFPC